MTGARVLYRDAQLVALDKPAGLLVHRGWDQDPVVALDLARELVGARVHPVHRLDRGTSGVLLFALDPVSAAHVQRQLESGACDKRYLALVRGVTPDSGTIDHPVPRTEGGPRVPAVTDFVRLHTSAAGSWRFSVVEARPRGGRFHQVRRHMKHLGHPLVGDVNYGRCEINRYFREHHALHRLALHAARLSLTHPATNEALTIAAPLAPELARVFAQFGWPDPEAHDV